jgi:hypothetical protein
MTRSTLSARLAALSKEYAGARIDAESRMAKVTALLDVYFAPWGAAKAERWAALTGDADFTAESALREIRKILSVTP